MLSPHDSIIHRDTAKERKTTTTKTLHLRQYEFHQLWCSNKRPFHGVYLHRLNSCELRYVLRSSNKRCVVHIHIYDRYMRRRLRFISGFQVAEGPAKAPAGWVELAVGSCEIFKPDCNQWCLGHENRLYGGYCKVNEGGINMCFCRIWDEKSWKNPSYFNFHNFMNNWVLRVPNCLINKTYLPDCDRIFLCLLELRSGCYCMPKPVGSLIV